jgi:hypothetical protein
MKWAHPGLAVLGVVAPAVLGCGVQAGTGGDGDVGTATLAQLDWGPASYMPYTLVSPQSSYEGTIISTGSPGYSSTDHLQTYTIDAESEYWIVPSGLLSTLNSASSWFYSVSFVPGTAASWPRGGPITGFSAVETAEQVQPVGDLTWSTCSTPTTAFCNSAGNVAVSFANMAVDGKGDYSGSTDWYYLGSSAPTGNLIPASGTTTLHYGAASAAPSGESWWHASVAITSVYLP